MGWNLLSMLWQDIQLPEDSVDELACDLAGAPQYVHSNGITYRDLKPSTILLDENGRTKLCDFRFVQKVQGDMESSFFFVASSKTWNTLSHSSDGGVHPYTSDFWALVCECYAGRPLLVGKEFARLVKSIGS